MQENLMKLLIRFCILIGLITAESAHAGNAISSLNLSTTVIGMCTVSATPLNFPYVDASTTTFANGSVIVNCTLNTPYTIALDGGLHYLASGSRAIYDNSGNGIPYVLYSNVGLSSQWGDSGATNPYPSVPDTGTGADQEHIVYGALLVANSFGTNINNPGIYSDIVTVSVIY